MKFIALFLLAVSPMAWAAPFVEIGAGHPLTAGDCVTNRNTGQCTPGPVGFIAAGYAWGGLSLQLEHYSGLRVKDRGLNMVTVKYRWTWQ